MAETKHHRHRIRNSSIKAARIARTVIDLKTVTTDDVEQVLRDSGARDAILRATLDPKGEQRWKTASPEIWDQVEMIVIGMLEDVFQ